MRVKSRPGESELPLLRGVLFTLRRKCGKPNCRCATGDAHESPALAYRSEGRTKTMTLTEADVPRVQGALDRYREARERLDAAAESELASLQAHVAARRQRRR